MRCLDDQGWGQRDDVACYPDQEAVFETVGEYVKARAWEDIPLYWQHWKGEVASMALLTRAILQASSTLIRRRR